MLRHGRPPHFWFTSKPPPDKLLSLYIIAWCFCLRGSSLVETQPESNIRQQYPGRFLWKYVTLAESEEQQEQDAINALCSAPDLLLFHSAGCTVCLSLRAASLTPPWRLSERGLCARTLTQTYTHTHTVPFSPVSVKSGIGKHTESLLSRFGQDVCFQLHFLAPNIWLGGHVIKQYTGHFHPQTASYRLCTRATCLFPMFSQEMNLWATMSP